MKNLYLSEILKITDGINKSNIKKNPKIKNVITCRSQRLKDNNTLIFFPDKNKLLKNISKLKSSVIVTQNPNRFVDFAKFCQIIFVKDSEKAYRRFIDYYRKQFPIPIIGITGTCGKTTTKEMVAKILEKKDSNVVKTERSQNGRNENIRYLMKIDKSTDYAIIEVGVGYPGGIKEFGRFFKPNIGVITTIGTDHIKGFKTQEAYIREKASMLKVLNHPNGTIILNKDDQIIRNLDLKQFKGKIVYFGLSNDAHFKASNIQYIENGMKFTLHYGSEVHDCSINSFGYHNVYNVLAAIAVTTTLGVDIKEAIQSLKDFQHIERHLQLRIGINNCLLIDDTWNTNSKSIESALEVLSNISKGRKTIAVIGDIEELGDFSESEHIKIGDFVRYYNINQLITIGNKSKLIAKRAFELGMDKNNIFNLNEKKELVRTLKKIANDNSIVLIKTSMRDSFDKVLKQLIID
jgi:UDP-N-acetylmuramoyl-tripeptide--D-alanyl-D-alanine ligase